MNVDDGLEDISCIRGLGARGCPRRPMLFSETWKGWYLVPGISSHVHMTGIFIYIDTYVWDVIYMQGIWDIMIYHIHHVKNHLICDLYFAISSNVLDNVHSLHVHRVTLALTRGWDLCKTGEALTRCLMIWARYVRTQYAVTTHTPLLPCLLYTSPSPRD